MGEVKKYLDLNGLRHYTELIQAHVGGAATGCECTPLTTSEIEALLGLYTLVCSFTDGATDDQKGTVTATDIHGNASPSTVLSEHLDREQYAEVSALTGGTALTGISYICPDIKPTTLSFSGCTALTHIDDPLPTDECTDLTNLFKDCSNLTSINGFTSLAKAVTLTRMFYGCAKLTEEHLSQVSTSLADTLSNLFVGCTGLTHYGTLNIKSGAWAPYLFMNCSNLQSVDTINIGTASGATIYGMFQSCSSLTSVPPMATQKVTSFENMFFNCTRLSNVGQLNTSSATKIDKMFRNCNALTCIGTTSTSVAPTWTLDLSKVQSVPAQTFPSNLVRMRIDGLGTVPTGSTTTAGTYNFSDILHWNTADLSYSLYQHSADRSGKKPATIVLSHTTYSSVGSSLLANIVSRGYTVVDASTL